MSFKRTTSFLAACSVLLLWGASAFAEISDMQLFAPADLNGFGGGTRATEGLFFSFDGLYWSISHPSRSTIGTDIQPQGAFNSETTGFIPSDFRWGQRIEAGTIHDHQGLLFSYFQTNHHSCHQRREAGTTIIFGENFIPFQPDAPDDSDLLFADDFRVRDSVTTWGVELNYLLRSHPMHNGGFFELFGGVRYLEFNEEFSVIANRDALGRGLDRFWLMATDNHIVGPQIGARWFRQWGRWQTSAEGRYLAGYNSQSYHLQGQIEVLDNFIKAKGSFNSADYENEFANTAELRVELKYQLTSVIFLKVGYTAIWIDQIARASKSITYDNAVNGVGINSAHHQEDVFLNGVNFGLTINR